MDINDIKARLNEYKCLTEKNADWLKLGLVMSIDSKTTDYKDFSAHSIKTTYLTDESCNNLIRGFRENGIYTKVYSDIETFIKEYYSGKMTCNIIFESSPKGISNGKDALMPAFFDMIELMHVGSAASINMVIDNKFVWYNILRNNGICVPETFYFNGCWQSQAPLKHTTYILKLNEECASIGLSIDSVIKNDIGSLTLKAKKLNQTYNEPVIAQQFINGYEVEVPILVNNKQTIVLPPIGLSLNKQRNLGTTFFSYENISNDAYGVYKFADEKVSCSTKLEQTCIKVAGLLNLNGYYRIDFRITDKEQPYVIDINNDPTLGHEGSFLFSFKSLGYDYKDMLAIILGNYLSSRTNIACP